MRITENARQYHERMFPGYHSKFLETDPEFIELSAAISIAGWQTTALATTAPAKGWITGSGR